MKFEANDVVKSPSSSDELIVLSPWQEGFHPIVTAKCPDGLNRYFDPRTLILVRPALEPASPPQGEGKVEKESQSKVSIFRNAKFVHEDLSSVSVETSMGLVTIGDLRLAPYQAIALAELLTVAAKEVTPC